MYVDTLESPNALEYQILQGLGQTMVDILSMARPMFFGAGKVVWLYNHITPPLERTYTVPVR